MTDTVWGKAGERITVAERRRRQGLRRMREQLAEQRQADQRRQDRAAWERGELAPWRITMALDAKGLEGPEVDAQCLAVEPEVDLWETGELYPTWEQLCALGELTGCTPGFFMHTRGEHPKIDPLSSTMMFHVPVADAAALRERRPVLRFPPHVVAQRMSGEPIELPPAPPPVRPGEQVSLLDDDDLPEPPPKPAPIRLPADLRPGELPECTGDCGRPMARKTWLRQNGRCSRCGPA